MIEMSSVWYGWTWALRGRGSCRVCQWGLSYLVSSNIEFGELSSEFPLVCDRFSDRLDCSTLSVPNFPKHNSANCIGIRNACSSSDPPSGGVFNPLD